MIGAAARPRSVAGDGRIQAGRPMIPGRFDKQAQLTRGVEVLLQLEGRALAFAQLHAPGTNQLPSGGPDLIDRDRSRLGKGRALVGHSEDRRVALADGGDFHVQVRGRRLGLYVSKGDVNQLRFLRCLWGRCLGPCRDLGPAGGGREIVQIGGGGLVRCRRRGRDGLGQNRDQFGRRRGRFTGETAKNLDPS